jgi:hypothetical protein
LLEKQQPSPPMIKYLILSAVLYFILSRYVFQGKTINEQNRFNSETSPKKERNTEGDYVDYEEVE